MRTTTTGSAVAHAMLSAIAAMLMMLAMPLGRALRAQDTASFNLRQTADLYDERGFLQNKAIFADGHLLISESGGTVSYSYPISSYTKKGYPIKVELNYCGAVNCTAFGGYSTTTATGFGAYKQRWNRFDQSRPVWMLSVNGWAVQCLSQATAFHAMPSLVATDFDRSLSTRTSFNDRDVPWVIDGYDYSNRMRNLASGVDGDYNAYDYVDVIRLLRGDGSVLELHNSNHTTASDFLLDEKYYTGYYHVAEANSRTFAVVEVDSTSRPGFLTSAGVSLSDLAEVHQLQPRVVHLFTGDGLEYTFREQVIPYGTADYNAATASPNFGGMLAGPTIFYLTGISSNAGRLMTFKRSRQNGDGRYLAPVPDSWFDPAGDSTRGRALVTEFDDHTITYDRDQITIQALGRTTLVRFWDVLADGNAQDSIGIPFKRLGYPGQLSQDEAKLAIGDAELYKSWLGYVNEIIDPEGRATTFDYEQVLRRYKSCGFPYTNGSTEVDFNLRNLRLKQITEPTASYRLSYKATGPHSLTPYGPDDWIPIYGAYYGPDKTTEPWLLHDMIDSVVKSDCSGPLSTEVYDYQGSGPTISMAQHTTTDLVSGTVRTRKLWYDFLQLPLEVPALPRPRFTELVRTLDTIAPSATSPGVGTTTVTTYDSLAPYIVQPRTVTESINGMPKTRTRYEYVLTAARNYDTNTAANARYAWEIAERTEYRGCACDTQYFNNYRTGTGTTTKYASFPEFHVSSVSGAGRYDEHASFVNYEDYYAAHPGAGRPDFESVKYDPAFAVWDPNDSDGYYLPPIYDQDTSVITTDGITTIDRRTWYSTGNFADGTHVPRGWPLRDTTYGQIGTGAKVIGGGTLRSYVHDAAFDQWRPFSTTNGVGAVSQGEFSDDSLAAGILDDRDSVWTDRHGPPNALAWTFEQPTLERRLVRRATSGGGTRTDTLLTHHDYTFYGQPAETTDPNGWTSRGLYDRDGRLRSLRLPLDYDAVASVDTFSFDGTKRVDLYGSSVDTVVYDTLVCDKAAWLATHGTLFTPTSFAYERFAGDLQVDRPTVKYPSCVTCSGTKKGDASSLQTTCTAIPFEHRSPRVTYVGCTIRPPGTSSIASLDSARLVLLVTQNETRCANLIVEIPQFNFRRTYVFGCMDAPVQVGHNGSRAHSSGTPAGSVAVLGDACDEALTEVYRPDGYLFRVDLSSIKDSLIAAGNRGDVLTVRLSTATPGASISFSSDFYADYRPSLELVGSFATYSSQKDYTLAYDDDDAHLKTTVRDKVDDSRHTASHLGSGSAFAIRQSERVHRFGADFRLRKTLVTIGDPASPTRIDSVVNRYDGLGAKTGVTDQEGDTAATEYDALGRPIRIHNGDGTVSTVAYYYGHFSTFGLPADTLHYAIGLLDSLERPYDSTGSYVCDFMAAKVTTNENGTRSVQYFDALDRLRREVIDSGGTGHLHLTTTFDYDQLGRMTRAINPKGDTTLYVYDELGRVLYKSQPDLGTISYAYDRLGNVRFSQTEEQADSNRLTYTEYDDLNRVTMIGEATVDPPGGSGFGSRVSRGGGSGIVTGVARRGGKERSSLLSGASTLHRLTDTLDGNRLYLSSTYGGPVTVNTTIHLGTSGPAPPTLPALTLYDSVYCTLTMNEMLGETETPVGPFLGHPVQYYTPVTTPHGSMGNFEHLKFNPHFVRTVIAYDTMPAIAGSIWGTLPAWSQWDSLAPHGKVRNLRGHEAAIAYREHGGEPYHYVVMSYDERGRVEALMRYTENLGFDAVYYGYNSANQVTSVRVADPIREYQSWYGYDWNGRVDTVWSLLGGVWSGLGIRAPRRPAPLAQPATPDIAYDYTKAGRLSAMRFPPAGVLVSYAYDHRKWLDSLVATQSASPLFKEVLGYDPTGQIVMQRYAHGAGSDQTELYRYDSAQRLVRWVHGADSTSWGYDAAGNRSDQIRRVPLVGLRTDSYTYGGTGVGGSNRLGDVITQDSTGAVTGLKQHAYNANGSLTSRTVLTGIGGSLLKEEHFGYGYRELTNQYIDGAPASSSRLDWRYRYNAQGEREQKRVYYGPDGDEYEHVYPWAYYLLGGAKEQLAVYHGQQMLGGPCTPSGRSVLLYPVEYNTFGVTFSGKLEDIALVSTRISSTSPGGAKEYKITDHLSSTRAVAIATGSTSEYDYTPSGSVLASSTGMAARLGFNGRQEDRESGDLNLGFRQFNDDDLRFLTIDRRREQFPEISPYVYSYDNPLRYTDPDGLQGRDMVFDPNPILPGGGRYGGGGAGGLGVLLFLFKGAEYMADQFHTWYNEATSQNDAPQAGKQTENQTAAPPTPQKSKDWKYYPVPETELIKGLNPAKGKTVIPGTRGKLRRRWKDADGKIYEWDSQHGTLEVYDKRGKHLKEINPSTGEETKGKNKDREVEP